MTVKFSLIQYSQEIIKINQASLDFKMLAYYVLHKKEMLCYIALALYKLQNIKIAFKNCQPIGSKLY